VAIVVEFLRQQAIYSAAVVAGLVWPTEVDDAVTAYWRRNGLDG